MLLECFIHVLNAVNVCHVSDPIGFRLVLIVLSVSFLTFSKPKAGEALLLAVLSGGEFV